MDSSHPGRTARWLVVAFLAALAGGLAVEWWHSTTPAVAQVRADGRPMQIQAIPGQISRDTYGVFLVDGESGRMAVYELAPGDKVSTIRMIRLIATRNVAYDLRLDDYNNLTPRPGEVRALVEQQTSLETTTPQP